MPAGAKVGCGYEQRGAELGAGAAGDDAVKTDAEIIEALVEEVRTAAEIDYRDFIERLSPLCDSPIERVLISAWHALSIYNRAVPVHMRHDPWDFNTLRCGECGDLSEEYLGAAYPQANVLNYRIDFYIEAFDRETGHRIMRLAIECDGHDFHEKTKEQAARDKRRDRRLLVNGIQTLRFTGSEIWRNPQACIDDIDQAILVAWQRKYRPERL